MLEQRFTIISPFMIDELCNTRLTFLHYVSKLVCLLIVIAGIVDNCDLIQVWPGSGLKFFLRVPENDALVRDFNRYDILILFLFWFI